MNEPSIAPPPAPPSDPTLLTLHLDICRMRTELDLLDARISRIRASEAEAAADTRPFGERAQELVDRTVASLLEVGRAEIEDLDRQSRLDAEASLAEASRQAQDMLATARAELADALNEQADGHEQGRVPEAQLVILPDDWLIVLPGDDLVTLPGDDLVAADEPTGSVAEATGVLPADPEAGPVDDAAVAALPVPAIESATEDVVDRPEPVEAPVEEPVWAPPAPPVVDAEEGTAPEAASELTTFPPPPPSVEVLPVEPVPAETVPMETLPMETVPTDEATLVEPGPDDAAPSGTMPSDPDAAYDLWLAMAPPEAPDADAEAAARGGSGRRWVRTLEALAALLLVAVLVIIALVVVG